MGSCLFAAVSSMLVLERRRPPLRPASSTNPPSFLKPRGGLRSPTNHIIHISLTNLISPGNMTITPRHRVQPQRLRRLYVPLMSCCAH
ncbi:unnamed protein product, partial [Ixodes hexagonus]